MNTKKLTTTDTRVLINRWNFLGKLAGKASRCLDEILEPLKSGDGGKIKISKENLFRMNKLRKELKGYRKEIEKVEDELRRRGKIKKITFSPSTQDITTEIEHQPDAPVETTD